MPPEPSVESAAGIRLSHFLAQARDEIVRRWADEIRSLPGAPGLSDPALLDHVPELLDSIAEVLRAERPGEHLDLGNIPDQHAIERLHQGFSLKTVATELAALRRVALSMWRESGRAGHRDAGEVQAEAERFDSVLDDVVTGSLERYAASRERVLGAIDRVSAAALSTSDVDRFLIRMLRIVLEETAAHTGIMLSAAEDVLTVRATEGLGAELVGLTVGLGEDFAGRAAREGTPSLVLPPFDQTTPTGRVLSATPLRSLYAIPLRTEAELLGVVCFGSAAASTFSHEDRWLFTTVAERATAVLVQARLREQERTAVQERGVALEVLDCGDATIVTDAEYRVVLVNREAEVLSGVPASELRGRNIWELWPDLARPDSKYYQQYHLCMDHRVPVRFEEYYHARGIWTSVSAHPAANGGIAIFWQDITAEKAQAARLRALEQGAHQRERELSWFFSASRDFLAIVGTDGFIKRANPATSIALGYTEEELLSRPWVDFVHPDDRARSVEKAREVANGLSVDVFQVRMLRKDGKELWVSFRATGQRGADVFTSVGRDITQQRQQAEFERQLIGIVSHDLRNPLSTIMMAVSALQRQSECLDERSLRAVSRIHSAGERAVALISDLLDFTKARSAGGIPIEPQPVDLHTLARCAAQEVLGAFPDRSVQFHQSGLGEGRWDPARITQVVTNLVSNAFKYGCPSGPVLVRTVGGEPWVRLEVQNPGQPIDPVLLPHLFEPLRRGHRPAAGGEQGVGLGLYIVDHIVRAHGGSIDVRSTRSDGTTFVVHLPREAPANNHR